MPDPIESALESSDPRVRRAAIFDVFSQRRADLLGKLKEYALSESIESLAILATQVYIALSGIPKDANLESDIFELLLQPDGINAITPEMWRYLGVAGKKDLVLTIIQDLKEKPPKESYIFIDRCLGHPDPQIRLEAVKIAAKAHDPTIFAHLLVSIIDPDENILRTAFTQINKLARSELAALLDQSLRSSEDWVLSTIAPFLTIFASEELRTVYAKFRDHPHPAVSVKVREALAKMDRAKARAAKLAQAAEKASEIFHPKTSSEPALAGNSEPSMPNISNLSSKPPQKTLQSPSSFGVSAAPPRNFAVTQKPFPTVVPVQQPLSPPKKDRLISARKIIKNESQIDKSSQPPPVLPQTVSNQTASVIPSNIVSTKDASIQPVVAPTPSDAQSDAQSNAQSNAQSETTILPPVKAQPAAVVANSSDATPSPKIVSPQPDGATIVENAKEILLQKPAMIDSILTRFPSFLTIPLNALFQKATAEDHLENLRKLVESLTAFLNFTFVQTNIFFAPRSQKVDQIIVECLRSHLGGPNGIRFIHNLGLNIKNVTGNDSFFTFILSRLMSEAPDNNPLIPLKELSEFIIAPREPLNETITEAVAALPRMLIGYKVIIQNKIAQRNNPGEKPPFIDLSGPEATPLGNNDRPVMDLPPGEIVVLSKNRAEALGLFPYFTFNGKTVKFAIPSSDQFATLLERLELKIN